MMGMMVCDVLACVRFVIIGHANQLTIAVILLLVSETEPQEAEWKALPLLLICKRLSNIAMKELYRNVYLTSREDTLTRLMSRPLPHTYQYIETLNMMEVESFCWDTLNKSIAYRIVQLQGTALDRLGMGPRWSSSLEDAERFSKYWSSEVKPRLKALISARGAVYWLTSLLKL
jgi:hypothetical protein